MAGLRLPIESHVLQAFVSEGIKPAIDQVVTFAPGIFYISQSTRAACVRRRPRRLQLLRLARNLPIVEDVMEEGMAIWPGLGRIRMLRQWGGLMDIVDGRLADHRPHACRWPYLNCGWCYGGFKATPASAGASRT